MTRKLLEVKTELDKLARDVRTNKDLPAPEHSLIIAITLNAVRKSVIELDIALHARHKERHPMRPPPIDLAPTQPLSPEDRADIDATS